MPAPALHACLPALPVLIALPCTHAALPHHLPLAPYVFLWIAPAYLVRCLMVCVVTLLFTCHPFPLTTFQVPPQEDGIMMMMLYT